MEQQTNEKNLTQMEPAGNDYASAVIPEDYQFNLSDFALFLSVMKVKEAYADVLSIIMDEAELRLKEVKVEQVVLNKSGKRARFYQSMLDTPLLKSGKATRYKNLPSTVIIFITQDDIFRKDLAMYTFTEHCEEVPDLSLEDGTTKIFVNMTSRNGRQDLVSLLQYMKHTTLDNPDIIVKDERILELDRIVNEVKQSEEWEAVKMNILEIGLEQGMAQGMERGLEKGARGIIEICQDLGVSQSETQLKLKEKLSLTEDAAREQLEKYWK